MSATPNDMVILALNEAARDHVADVSDPVDVTEAVKFAYDTVISSLDWGSGFLSHEEQHLIYDLGRTLGFEPPEYMMCHFWTDGDGQYRNHERCKFEGIDDGE